VLLNNKQSVSLSLSLSLSLEGSHVIAVIPPVNVGISVALKVMWCTFGQGRILYSIFQEKLFMVWNV